MSNVNTQKARDNNAHQSTNGSSTPPAALKHSSTAVSSHDLDSIAESRVDEEGASDKEEDPLRTSSETGTPNESKQQHDSTTPESEEQQAEWGENKCKPAWYKCGGSFTIPEWMEPVLKTATVPFVIFWGAFLVSAIGVTGSILSVDTTVGNMMNITAQLGTEEIRYTAAEYAFKGDLASRLLSDLEHSTGQMQRLEEYAEDSQGLRDTIEKQWSAFRSFLGKQVAEDEALLWMEVWDVGTGRMYGASSLLDDSSGWPAVYDYLPQCVRACEATEWTACCEGQSDYSFSRWRYQWWPSVSLDSSFSDNPSKYALHREGLRTTRLGQIYCPNEHCVEDFSEEDLWVRTGYIERLTKDIDGQRLPKDVAFRPSWNVLSAAETKKLPMVSSSATVEQVAILMLPMLAPNDTDATLKVAAMAIDTSIFAEKAMAALAISGVGDKSSSDFTGSGYALSDGGCFGIVDLESNTAIGGDKSSQGDVEKNAWKHVSEVAAHSSADENPNYHPIDLCSQPKLAEYAQNSESSLRSYLPNLKEMLTSSRYFGKLLPGSLSFWPIGNDKDPSGASTASYYRNPYGSDDAAGEAVVAFHVASLRGWPVQKESTISVVNLAKDAADAAFGPNKLAGYSSELERFLPNWGFFIGTPRTEVIGYIQSQMTAAILLTIAVVCFSVIVLMHLAVQLFPKDHESDFRILRWGQRIIKSQENVGFAARMEKSGKGERGEDTSMTLGGLQPHSIILLLVTFALTMFLTFVSSSTWGRATDDVSYRVASCASALGSREVIHTAHLRHIGTTATADVHSIHFLAPPTLFDRETHYEKAFSEQVKHEREEYRRNVFATQSKEDFLSALTDVPEALLQSTGMKAATCLGFIEVISAFNHVGLGSDASGGTVWGDTENGGYVAVQPVSLDTAKLSSKGDGVAPGVGNSSMIAGAWSQSILGSLSLLIRREADETDGYVTEYVLYPSVQETEVLFVKSGNNMPSSASLVGIFSWHKSPIDLMTDLLVGELIDPVARDAFEDADAPADAQDTVKSFRDVTFLRSQPVASTESSLDLSALPWFGSVNHFRRETSEILDTTACNSLKSSMFQGAPSKEVVDSMFSSRWTYTYAVWSPSSALSRSFDTAVAAGRSERRTFIPGGRTISLGFASVQPEPLNGSSMFSALGNFVAQQWLQKTDDSRISPDEQTKSSRVFRNLTTNLDSSFTRLGHVEFTLAAFNQLLGNVDIHFSTRSPFDNTSPFEISINDYDQPHRLVVSEGPLRSMYSVETRQVSLSRFLAFSTAHNPALTEDINLAEGEGALSKDTRAVQRSICTSSGCLTNFPRRSITQSSLFTSAGQSSNKFDAIVRPPSILVGASHGGVLQTDRDHGGFEREFVRESKDVFVETAALEIANDVEFFQYNEDASTVVQTAVKLGDFKEASREATSLFGIGSHAEFIHSKHLIGGASGASMLTRYCLNHSLATVNGAGENALLSASLIDSLRTGDDMDVLTSGLIHRQTIKRESESWQWALFLIALGPLLASTLVVGMLTTWLRKYYKKRFKGGRKSTFLHPPSPSVAKAADQRRLRKLSTANALIRSSMRAAGRSGSHVRSESYTHVSPQLEDESAPLIPADPVIESAMHAVHHAITQVYSKDSEWQKKEREDMHEAALLKKSPPKHCWPRCWHWIKRVWQAPPGSNHVTNPLAGMDDGTVNSLLCNESVAEQANPINESKRRSLATPRKSVRSSDELSWEHAKFRRAREFIHMYSSDRHALEAVILDREGRFRVERLHRLFYTKFYVYFIYIVIAGLLVLAFFEASDTVFSGGRLEDASVIVSNGEILPSDSPDTSASDLQVDIGSAFEGAEELAAEHSVDGLEGWSAESDGAWGTFSADNPVEEVAQRRSRVLLFEFFVLILLGMDNFLFYFLKGFRKSYYWLYDVKAASNYRERSERLQNRHLGPKSVVGNGTKDGSLSEDRRVEYQPLHKLYVIRLVLYVALVLDFFVRLGLDYRTGRSATLLPATVLVRPFYTVLRVPPLRRSLQALGSTVLLARRTFALFITFTIVIASITIALFSDYTDLGAGPVGGSAPSPLDNLPFAQEDSDIALDTTGDSRFDQFQLQQETIAVGGANKALQPHEVEEFSLPGLARGYTNFQSAWYTLFILSATGENYDDLAYPARDPTEDGGFLGAIYRPYIVLLALLGMFIMAALLLVSFQTRYTESYEVRTRRVITRRRFAPLVAFGLLDLDGNGLIDRYEYETFFNSCGVKPSHYDGLNEKLSATEFVYLCEYLTVNFGFDFEKGAYKSDLFLSDATSFVERGAKRFGIFQALESFRQWLYSFFDNSMRIRYDDVVLAVVLIHTWTIMLLGTRLTSYADPIMGAFSFLQAIEVFFHMVATGPAEFWFGRRPRRKDNVSHVMREAGSKVKEESESEKRKADEGKKTRRASIEIAMEDVQDEEEDVDARSNYQVSANRFDSLVMIVAILAVIGTSFIGVDQPTDRVVQPENRYTFAVNVGMRIAVTLPVLRLFSVIHSTRRLVFGLIKQGNKFVHITVLIFLTMYTFAIFGVWLFSGQFQKLSDDSYSLPPANFDTFTNSMFTLFLVMEGEQWHVVSYAAADSRYSLVPLAYFVLFVVINSLLFVNLFIGVLCDTFGEVEEKELEKARKKQQRDLEEEMLEG
eukprot:gb/GECG01012031.1/.p1 GENE.gb/GECG01012031.1/~~gb/GECG01012031.1/.p1  ORF type:complete len:2648 (+),score=309.14 gb/GECG01012031.1/:1-7944(+)